MSFSDIPTQMFGGGRTQYIIINKSFIRNHRGRALNYINESIRFDTDFVDKIHYLNYGR